MSQPRHGATVFLLPAPMRRKTPCWPWAGRGVASADGRAAPRTRTERVPPGRAMVGWAVGGSRLRGHRARSHRGRARPCEAGHGCTDTGQNVLSTAPPGKSAESSRSDDVFQPYPARRLASSASSSANRAPCVIQRPPRTTQSTRSKSIQKFEIHSLIIQNYRSSFISRY